VIAVLGHGTCKTGSANNKKRIGRGRYGIQFKNVYQNGNGKDGSPAPEQTQQKPNENGGNVSEVFQSTIFGKLVIMPQSS
jgi:hypothetical protein